MLASEFINEDIPFDSVESLSTNGATSLAYKVLLCPCSAGDNSHIQLLEYHRARSCGISQCLQRGL